MACSNSACAVTAGSGNSKGLENAMTSCVRGKLEGVDTNLPGHLKEEAILCFEAAVANRMNIGDCINKVEQDVLTKCNDEFKGARYKGYITFNYESNMISIQINKFAGGNCNFSAGISTSTKVCPDPFMGALNDQMAQFNKYRP